MVHAIERLQRTLYRESASELTPAEAELLRLGGFELADQPGPDPLAEPTAEFVALLSTPKALRRNDGHARKVPACPQF